MGMPRSTRSSYRDESSILAAITHKNIRRALYLQAIASNDNNGFGFSSSRIVECFNQVIQPSTATMVAPSAMVNCRRWSSFL